MIGKILIGRCGYCKEFYQCCVELIGLTSEAYDPALGIELQFYSSLVRLRGRNLFPLFTLIGDHSVRWCWEADRAASLQSLETDPVIERIELGAAKSTGASL